MTTAVNEHTVKTGNVVLDMKIPLLTDYELDELARYADYLVWSRKDDDDDDWTDAPLTEDEKNQLKESYRDFRNGDYLTLDEFLEGL